MTEEMVAVLIIRTVNMVAVLIMSNSNRNKDYDHDRSPPKKDCNIIMRSNPHNKNYDHDSNPYYGPSTLEKDCNS